MQKTYDRQIAKFIAVVGENVPKLSSDVMRGWIQNPRELQKVLREALLPVFANVWKTVTLGRYKTPEAYRKALEDNGYYVSDYASQILSKISIAESEIKFDLVIKTATEFGFKDSVRRDRIYIKAQESGLQLCPAEMGPALRLAYPDQPCEERLRIAMEPIADSGDYLNVFGVDNDHNVRSLFGYYGSHVNFWPPGLRWVFVAPRE